MPFKSEKQRRYLFANEPKLAKKWVNMYGKKIIGLGGVKPVFTLKFINSEIKRIKPILKKYQVIAQKNLSYYKDLMTIQKYYLMLQSEKKKLSKK